MALEFQNETPSHFGFLELYSRAQEGKGSGTTRSMILEAWALVFYIFLGDPTQAELSSHREPGFAA